MIYFKFCDIPSKKSLRGKNVFIKLWDRISSSLGKFLNANPDIESKIDEVEQWVVEYDNTEYHQAIREIGIDSQGNIILKMPDDRNYGFWLDTGFTLNDFKKFGINYITEDEFNNLWNSVCYDRNNKIFKSLED